MTGQLIAYVPKNVIVGDATIVNAPYTSQDRLPYGNSSIPTAEELNRNPSGQRGGRVVLLLSGVFVDEATTASAPYTWQNHPRKREAQFEADGSLEYGVEM
jgi:hypothetical protein